MDANSGVAYMFEGYVFVVFISGIVFMIERSLIMPVHGGKGCGWDWYWVDGYLLEIVSVFGYR